MFTFKRPSHVSDAKFDKHVKLMAKGAFISESGAVTVDVSEALKQSEVKDQLKTVRRIREASRRYTFVR